VTFTGILWYLQGIVMFRGLQGIVMCAETSAVDRELLCLLGTLMSTENWNVYRDP